ncbi:MAG: hypothetical protein LLG15_13795 [Betaproteobacteria bacterium]|nr:hypothetical protein [Betaproteobacteria bacterium]
MFKRLSLLILGAALLAGVVYLGFLSGSNSTLLVWFGIASAIGAPAGIAAIGAAFKPENNEILERLAKVPEIEKLINEAKSQEEKVRALEAERQQLSELVKFESLRQSLLARREIIEEESVRQLKVLDDIDEELKQLDIQVEASGLSEQIEVLRNRVKLQDRDSITLFLAGRRHVINVRGLRTNPLGETILGYLMLLQELSRLLNRLFTRL